MCLSALNYIALNSLAKEDLSKSVIAEAYKNALNHQRSSFLYLLALSSAVRLPVEAYYPISKNETTKEKKDLLPVMFHCTIHPCMTAGLRPSDARLHMFWCALMPVDYSKVDKVPEDKNHYVALCKPKDNASDPTSIQQFVMMPVVPDYDLMTPLAKKLSQANLTLPSSVSQPSCVSQPKPSSISQMLPGCKPPFVPKSSSDTPKVKKKANCT